MEDLAHLRSLPHVYINKMMPEFDFGAASCWLEYVQLRGMSKRARIEENLYKNLVHVSFVFLFAHTSTTLRSKFILRITVRSYLHPLFSRRASVHFRCALTDGNNGLAIGIPHIFSVDFNVPAWLVK